MAETEDGQETRELIGGTLAALAVIADALCRGQEGEETRKQLIARLSEAAADARKKAPQAALPIEYLVEMLTRGIGDAPRPPSLKRD